MDAKKVYCLKLKEPLVDTGSKEKELLLSFLTWYDGLSNADKCSVWSPDGQQKGLFNMTYEQIVNKFLTRK